MRTLRGRCSCISRGVRRAELGAMLLAQVAPAAHAAAAPDARRTAAAGTSPVAEGGVGPQRRRRLLPRQLPAADRVLEEARQGVEPRFTSSRSARPPMKPAAADGDHHVAGELREARALQGDLAPALARPKGLTDDQARALAKEGKSVVWIDGGLHATRSARRAAAARDGLSDGRAHRRRDEAVPERRASSCCTPANPDGMDLVVRRVHEVHGSIGSTPVLYNHYAGHDDNRDSYMNALPETTNMSKVMYPRVVPADHVQPSPDRPGRRGDVRAAVPRSVQLQLPSDASPAGDGPHRRRSCATRVHRGRQAGRRQRARARATRRGGTAASARPPTSTTRSAS